MVIVKNNFKRMFKSKTNWVFFIILPMVLMSLMVQLQLNSNTYNIAVVDYDKTEYTQKLIERLGEIGNILNVEKDQIKEGLLESKYDYGIVIPKGITEKVLAGEDVVIEGYNIMESNVSEPLKYALKGYISSSIIIGENTMNPEEFFEILKEYEDGKVVCNVTDISDKEAAIKSNFITSLGIAALCIMLLLTFSTTLIIKDKDSGIYERIMTSPVTKAVYNAQHILSYFIIAIVQIVVLLFLAINLSHMVPGVYLIKIMLLFMFFALAAVALGIMVSNFSGNVRQANAIISLFTIPMCMLGGCLWDRSIMPEGVQKIGNLVPTTWLMKGIDATVSNVGSYTKSVLILGGFVIIFFGLSLLKSDER